MVSWETLDGLSRVEAASEVIVALIEAKFYLRYRLP